MTKAEFIDFVIHGLTGGKRVDSQFRKYHPQIVAMAADFAMGEIFHDLFTRDPSQLDLFAKVYEDKAVTYDDHYRTMSAALPAPVVQIKDNQGIRWVVDQAKPSEKLVPLSQDGAFNLHNLYANRVDNRASFYLSNQKILLSGYTKGASVATSATVLTNALYYQVDGTGSVTYDGTAYYNGEVIKGVTNKVLSLTGLTGYLWAITPPALVSMGLIVPIYSLATTDQVVVPSGQHGAVLAFVKAYFNNMGFQDLINDSKSNP